jgi:peptide/nickel transport system substrate-binding protein
MSTKFKPFDDIRVRQAINEAIDRKELMDQQGDKGVLTKGYFPPILPEYHLSDSELAKLPGFGPDMEKRRANARALLASAGFGGGLEMTLVGRPDLSFSAQIAEVVPQHLAKVGIKAQVKLMDNATYGPLESKSDLPFRTKNDSLRGLDPDDILTLNFQTGAGRNTEAYSDPQVDALLKQQTTTLDPGKRRELVLEIQRLVLTSSHRIPLWWPNAYVAVADHLKGFVPQALEDTAQLRLEQVWLDK